VKRSIVTNLMKQIDVIDTSALDVAMVDQWKKRNQALLELTDTLRKKKLSDGEGLYRHASMLSSLALPVVQRKTLTPLELTPDDLKPMRYAENSLFMLIAMAALTVLSLMFFPYYAWGRRKKLIHRTTDVLWLSMPWRSMILLVICSVAVPILYFVALTIWTPLTGKEYGASQLFLSPLFPAISLALILLLLPRLLVHHFTHPWQKLATTSKRYERRIGWVAFVLLLFPLHLLPTIILKVKMQSFILIFLGICWLPAALWVLWFIAKGFFARNFYASMMHGLNVRVLGVTTLSTMIFLSVISFALKSTISDWLQQDTVTAISPEMSTIRYEAEVVKRAHTDWIHLFR
jgi:hypothetical protein